MTKYCPDMTQEICKNLEIGMSRTDTCDIVGISYETFTVWMQKDEFSEAIKKAEQTCKKRNIGIIQKAAIKSWQAGAWWLERKHRDEFALRHEVTGSNGEALKIEIVAPQQGIFKPNENKPS